MNVGNPLAKSGEQTLQGVDGRCFGVKEVVSNVVMDVTFTSEWYDFEAEQSGAKTLINSGAVIISQHADSMGAPGECENSGVPNVTYNVSTAEQCPNTYVAYSKINWAPYYEHVINGFLASKKAGEAPKVENDWSEGLKAGSVEVDKASKNCPDGAQAKLDAVRKDLEDGKLHVFDLSKFTVGGEAPSAANMMPDPKNTYPNAPEADKLLANGYYHESEFRSAPSFDVFIDGITNLNTVF